MTWVPSPLGAARRPRDTEIPIMAAARPVPTPQPVEKPRRLGRGLSALLADPVAVQVGAAEFGAEPRQVVATSITEPYGEAGPASAGAAGANGLVHIALGSLDPSRFQPRRVFDEASIKGLADSIKSSGLMQPVIVRRAGSSAAPAAGTAGVAAARYELV